jgi:hypothetical protein
VRRSAVQRSGSEEACSQSLHLQWQQQAEQRSGRLRPPQRMHPHHLGLRRTHRIHLCQSSPASKGVRCVRVLPTGAVCVCVCVCVCGGRRHSASPLDPTSACCRWHAHTSTHTHTHTHTYTHARTLVRAPQGLCAGQLCGAQGGQPRAAHPGARGLGHGGQAHSAIR